MPKKKNKPPKTTKTPSKDPHEITKDMLKKVYEEMQEARKKA